MLRWSFLINTMCIVAKLQVKSLQILRQTVLAGYNQYFSFSLQGGAERWTELSNGKASDELVDILLREVASTGIQDSGGAEYFDGQVNRALFFIG